MSKISQLYGLSDQEIAHRELILSHKYDVKVQSTETQEVLLKILSTIETDGDLLSDGEQVWRAFIIYYTMAITLYLAIRKIQKDLK